MSLDGPQPLCPSIASRRQLSKVLRTKCGFRRRLIAEAVRAKALELCKPLMATVLFDLASMGVKERLRAVGCR
jgi:hypothetical protein